MAHGKRQYRNRIQIAANILEIAKEGSKKTRIMYLGNLSFDLLQKYLDLLIDYGLVEVHGSDDKEYVATEKGRHFLEEFYELQKYAEVVKEKRRVLETSFAR
jgi:predicted transcriptional regulator